MSIKDRWKRLDYWKRGALIGLIYSILTLGLVIILVGFEPLFVFWIVLLGVMTSPWSVITFWSYTYFLKIPETDAISQIFGIYWIIYFFVVSLLNILVGSISGFFIGKSKTKSKKKVLIYLILIWICIMFVLPIVEYRISKSKYESNRFPCNYFNNTQYKFENISFKILKQECKLDNNTLLFFFTLEAKNTASNTLIWSPAETFFMNSKLPYKEYVWSQGFHKDEYSYSIKPESSVIVYLYTFFENQSERFNLSIYKTGLLNNDT